MRSLMLLLAAAAPAFAQTNASFEVASIKPSIPGARQALAIQPGGRFLADGVDLRLLIALAYHLQAFELSVPDGWMMTDKWAIEARSVGLSDVPAWAPPNIPEVIATRLRSLLEDRFALKAHREARELKIYSLILSKTGSRLKAADAPTPAAIRAGPGSILAPAITMNQIVTLLGRFVDRPIIDKTGLTGYFNVRLQFAPPTVSDSVDPSIFTAIQEQLGLKLEPAREPVEVLVVDSAQRPADN